MITHSETLSNPLARILIVEDDLKDQKLMSANFLRHGYICETVSRGADAIASAKLYNPDIILLDVMLPDIDGINTCKHLKSLEETRHIPIISLTGADDRKMRLDCLDAGANDFINKPIDFAELLIKIRNLVQLKQFEDIKLKHAILAESVKAIEAAKREWEQSMDCIKDVVMLIDVTGLLLRCNKVLSTLSGKRYGELLGRHWRTVLEEGGFQSVKDSEYHHSTGLYFSCSTYNVSARNHDFAAVSIITLHDITERKKMEDEIRRRRRGLQKAVDEISSLIREVSLKKNFSVRFENRSQEKDIFSDIGEQFNNMMQILETQHLELEKAYNDLKMVQSQVLQQEKMASIGQLAAGVAHEINNPIGFIISNLGTLRKYMDKISEYEAFQSTEVAGCINRLGDQSLVNKIAEKRKDLKIDYIEKDLSNLISESLEGADRVKKIVQDLKSFSHVDEFDFKTADINSGLDSTINIVWNELKYKVTLAKEYGEIPLTLCNLGQLNQVFMNLLVNAAQSIDRSGEIKVKTWHNDGFINISISDTGCGIPEEIQKRIFEPFFTTKEVGKGTGLGLSIAYDIVRKHHGEITVSSAIGKGTTFTMRIPEVSR
ncbi:MAG TPA: ATP-binding protein [Dissulfurispiraceae bacterium]|nr:ATP-binding protein [Dissulfurispiraceae bacterium]